MQNEKDLFLQPNTSVALAGRSLHLRVVAGMNHWTWRLHFFPTTPPLVSVSWPWKISHG